AARAGVALERAGWEDAVVAPGVLDAMCFWHVLEHLDAPGAAVERAAGWLRPGGVVLVGVPNLDSWQAWVGGDRWYHLDVPRHRVHFTPRGVDALLRRAGLEPLRVHHVLAEHNPFGLWQSAVSRATTTPSWLYHALKRNAPLRSRDAVITAAALPLAPVAALAEQRRERLRQCAAAPRARHGPRQGVGGRDHVRRRRRAVEHRQRHGQRAQVAPTHRPGR